MRIAGRRYRAVLKKSTGTTAVAAATITVSLAAGPDVGQYFDRGGYATGLPNYPDNSSHPLRGLTTPDTALLFGGACELQSGDRVEVKLLCVG